MIYIYAYENKINGKIYIGQTTNLFKRDRFHCGGYGIKQNSAIDRAIKKYGRDSFNCWIFVAVDTIEQANQEEIYWIAEMRNQLGNKMIYNISSGGNRPRGWLGIPRSKETKEKLSKKFKGRKAAWTRETNLRTGSAHIPSFNHKGKTWKMINGKRKWMEV